MTGLQHLKYGNELIEYYNYRAKYKIDNNK